MLRGDKNVLTSHQIVLSQKYLDVGFVQLRTFRPLRPFPPSPHLGCMLVWVRWWWGNLMLQQYDHLNTNFIAMLMINDLIFCLNLPLQTPYPDSKP